jgi:LysM repeat protein
MRFNRFLGRLTGLTMLLLFGIGALDRLPTALADGRLPAPPSQVSASELIMAMNTLRVSYGLPALIEDPIVNAVAQATAATMAANNLSWHIGNVRGRLAAAGYGSGATVWATENFAVGRAGRGIDEIMAAWADPDHMRPAVEPAYCHVGAGVAQTSEGRIYYILQAAYVSGQPCGTSPQTSEGASQPGAGPGSVSQLSIPVKIATSDADGRIFHEVQAGQSFWSIAIAYQITIRDLEVWNNLSRTVPLRAGQRLFIPNEDTAGYATPTPFGMVVPQTPDAEGKIIHEVQPYQALITIAEAYHVSVDQILTLNSLREEWPLQIGQKLTISPGNITPSPTLSNIQKLTPEADGNYYYIIQSGETLSGIADRYDIPLAELMAWNGLNTTSIIRPEQKLLLLVTPPVIATATAPPQPTAISPSPSPSLTPSPPATPSVATPEPPRRFGLGLSLGIVLLVIGGLIWWRLTRNN